MQINDGNLANEGIIHESVNLTLSKLYLMV